MQTFAAHCSCFTVKNSPAAPGQEGKTHCLYSETVAVQVSHVQYMLFLKSANKSGVLQSACETEYQVQ